MQKTVDNAISVCYTHLVPEKEERTMKIITESD